MAGSSAFADFDHHKSTYETVWPQYSDMRATCPVAHSEQHGGFWGPDPLRRRQGRRTRQRDVLLAPGFAVPSIGGGGQSLPLDTDLPMHAEYRRLFTQALTPERIRAMRPFLKNCVDELVDGFVAEGGGDAVADIAVVLPLRVLTEVIGFSRTTVERLPALTAASWTRITTMSLHEARAEIRVLIDKAEIERHRAERIDDEKPTALLDAEVNGRAITHDELIKILQAFATAGHETTTNALSGLIYTLAADSEAARVPSGGARTDGRVRRGSAPRVRSPAQQLGKAHHARRGDRRRDHPGGGARAALLRRREPGPEQVR